MYWHRGGRRFFLRGMVCLFESFDLGVFASVPGALTRREQLMSSRGSCIGYKGGRAGREAVQALVRARPSRSLARAVIGV